jgi:hypothetical protein
MLRIERLETITGHPLPGFFVRNRADKVLAIGAFSSDGFVMPSRKRYVRDLPLCESIARLTGLPMKWNLSTYGEHISSGGNQQLMREVKRCSLSRHNHRGPR